MPNPIDILVKVIGGAQAAAELHKETTALNEVVAASQRATLSEEERYQEWLQHAAVRQEVTRRETAATAAASAAAWRGVGRVSEGAQAAAKSVGLARHESLNLFYQLNDIGVGLASGQSPFTVMVQQGSQVVGILAARSGGIRGALADVRASVNSLPIPPFALWAAGAAAAATAIAALVIKMQQVKAEAQERDKYIDIARMNKGRPLSNADAILEAFKAEQISAEEAVVLSAKNTRASKIPTNTKEGAQEQAALYTEIFQRLQQVREAAAGHDLAVEVARVKGIQNANRALRDGELEETQADYEAKRITLEQYLAKRLQLTAQAHAEELQVQSVQEAQARQALAGADNAGYQAAKSRLETVTLEKAAIEAAYANDVAAITRDRIKLTSDEEKQEAEEKKRRLKELAEFEKWVEENKQAALHAAREKFQTQTSNIGSDFRLTSPERYNALRAAAQAAADAGTLTREEFARFQAQLGPDPSSWIDQWTAGFTRLADSWGTLQESVVGSSLGLINAGIDGIANGIGRAIVVTGNFKQAWADVKIMILQALAQEVIAFGIRKGLAVAWKALTSGLRTADTTETVAAEGTKAAAAAPAATLLSISSYGLAAVIGLAAVLGALATLAFRESGGPVEAGRPYVVGEKRPELFVPRTSGFILPRVPSPDLPNLSGGGGGGGGAAAPASGPAGGSGVGIHMYGDVKSAMEAAIVSGAADQYLVNLIDGRVRRFRKS